MAALTIPTLLAGYQKEVLKTQFKKAYSVYDQNLEKTAMIDFDGSVVCFYPSLRNGVAGDIVSVLQTNIDCVDFFDKFAQNMKVIKTCKGNALADGCIPKYSSYPTTVGCGGFQQSYMNNKNTAYILADGNIMIPYLLSSVPLFAFDVNGFKGPNKPGHDLSAIGILKDINTGAYSFGTMRNDESEPIENNIVRCLFSTTEEREANALYSFLEDIYN